MAKQILPKIKPKKRFLPLILIMAMLVGATIYIAQKKLPEKPEKKDVVNVDTFNREFGSAIDDSQPVRLEGWGSWRTREEFDSKLYPDEDLVIAQNIDMNIKNSLAPRKGSLILGTASTETNPIKSMHTSRDSNGRELLIRTHSGVMDWLNKTSATTTWDQLDNGYTVGRIFVFADGSNSTESNTYTYFSNGAETLRRFPIAFGSVASNTSTGVILNSVTGFTKAVDQGFSAGGGTVTIHGSDYSYDSLNGLNLQGMSGLETFSVDEGVIGAVETAGFTNPPPTANAILIKNQRLHVAATSTVYASQIDDLQNFSFSATRVASEGEIISYPGEKITGLADRGKYIAVFKKNSVHSLKFIDYGENLSDIPTPDTIATGINVGAINQKGITQKDFEVIFTSDDIGLTNLTRLEQTDYDQPISLTEKIRPTAEEYDFSDTASIIWNKKILSTVRSDSDISFNNRIVLYDTLTNRLSELHGLNASSFAVYDSKLYFGDSITQNVRQIFYDENSDDGLPYSIQARTKWYNFGLPEIWKTVTWIAVEGWITKNTDIDFTILLDEGGDLSTKKVTIEGTGDYVASIPNKGTFGIDPFGINSFSPASKSDTLKHFVGWISTEDLYDKKFRNIAFDIKVSGVDKNFRIVRIIPYIEILDVNYMRDSGDDGVFINP